MTCPFGQAYCVLDFTARRGADEAFLPFQRMLIMRRRRAQISALICSLAVSAVLQAQSLGTLTGHVIGANGGLAGASVTITGSQRTAVTRSEGSYQLSVPAGRYEVRARFVGFIESIDSVTVTGGAATTKDFHIERVGDDSRERCDSRHAQRGAHRHLRARADRRAAPPPIFSSPAEPRRRR